MHAYEFSGLAQLRATPVILRMMTEGLTPEEASWKPSAKRWSVLEVLGHLAHVEVYGFRGRVERILGEENPLLPSHDPNSFTYDVPDLAEGLDSFERERGPSLRLLENLPASALARGGVHSALGPLTVLNLLNEWPLHDLGHIRQIAELIRAVKYYPHIGPWQNFYSLQP